MNHSVLIAAIAFVSIAFTSADARPPFRIYNDTPIQRVYSSPRVIHTPVVTSRRVVGPTMVAPARLISPIVVSQPAISAVTSPRVVSPHPQDIRSMHILDRPNRIGHFYGNTVRRLHYYGQLLSGSGRY